MFFWDDDDRHPAVSACRNSRADRPRDITRDAAVMLSAVLCPDLLIMTDEDIRETKTPCDYNEDDEQCFDAVEVPGPPVYEIEFGGA